jgi:uncharacterized protein YneF (UPF0154 family)
MKIGRTTNKTALYIIVAVVIIGAFLLLGGGQWSKGMHVGRSFDMANLNWVQILVSLGIGFLLGLLVSKRKW